MKGLGWGEVVMATLNILERESHKRPNGGLLITNQGRWEKGEGERKEGSPSTMIQGGS